MTVFGIFIAILAGLLLGSFATALAYRLPRDISMVSVKRSHCTSCNAALGIKDLIPLLSWLFSKGKCQHCGAAIGWQYPVIELGTVVLCVIFYAAFGLKPESAMVFLLAPVLVSIIDIDFRHKIIPDKLNGAILWIGIAAFLVNVAVTGYVPRLIIDKAIPAVGGVLVYGLGSWLISVLARVALKREAMGWGDIKFYAAAGFWLGFSLEAASLFMFTSGVIGTLIALIWKKITNEEEVPFGPALIIGFIAAVCFYPPEFLRI